MAKFELNYQKELIVSARKIPILAEITTDRFKRGRPDLFFKDKQWPAFFVECKYQIKRKTMSTVPIETTEWQKLCLNQLRSYGALAFVSVCVEMDKGIRWVYNVYDIQQETLDLNTYRYEPEYKEKGKFIWPIYRMLREAQSMLN